MEKHFLIDTPPPTISAGPSGPNGEPPIASLHMGHIFAYTQADLITSYYRMTGRDLLYPFCFDCNGLPTEKLALAQGITDAEAIKRFALDTSGQYKKLFDDIGIQYSDHQYNTFDPIAIETANLSFEDLKKKGLAYKKETEFWWCPKLEISISQSELTEDGRFERSGEKAILKRGEGWFIDIMNHLPDIRAAINAIEWKPAHFKERLLLWMDELKWDWSISRDRKFGIPIPGEENMTFDTWFISSLTPQLAWAAKTGEASLSCPIFDLRYQGHDIIRTWALFTIIKSLYHNEQIPWRRILITGHALAPSGNKLAKSEGNASDPYRLINTYGPSGLRLWSAQSAAGTDTMIDEAAMANAKRWQIKLTNAARFIDMQKAKGLSGRNEGMEKAWKEAAAAINGHMEAMDWHHAFDALYAFFWDRFCSEFIEASKREPATDSLWSIMQEMKPYTTMMFRL